MAKIHMIGIVSGWSDPLLIPRLKKAFETENPSVIAVGKNQKLLSFDYSRFGKAIDDFVGIMSEQGWNNDQCAILKTALLNVETEVPYAQEYAKEKGIPLHFLDNSYPSVNVLEKQTEFIQSLKNRKPKFEFAEFMRAIAYKTEETYHSIELLLGSSTPGLAKDVEKSLDSLKDFDYSYEREASISANLKELVGNLVNTNKALYLGNVLDILDDPQGRTVYARIKYLNPTRSTLFSYLPKMDMNQLFVEGIGNLFKSK